MLSSVIASPVRAGRGDLIGGMGSGPVEIATSLAGSLLATTGVKLKAETDNGK